jgi:SAM-dependent methyltransferase
MTVMKREKYFQLNQSNVSYNVDQSSGICDACGAFTIFEYSPIINEILAAQWELNAVERRLWSARESMYCVFCGCSYRLRMLARAIGVAAQDGGSKSLMQMINDGMFKSKKVAEINSCGVMHDILKNIPGILYSEYMPEDKTIAHQDLQCLTYEDNSLDYIFTSDVLEHVPDPKKALSEVYRVLKPGGCTVMSVPVVMDRKTKVRTQLQGDKVVYKEQSSYHGSGEPDYLVWNEFGYDFIEIVRSVGFAAYYLFVNNLKLDDPTGIVIAFKLNDKKATKIIGAHKPIAKELDIIWQAKRIQKLREKQNLTQKHVENLEAIISGYQTEQAKLKSIITQQQRKLDMLSSHWVWRIIRKTKSIGHTKGS